MIIYFYTPSVLKKKHEANKLFKIVRILEKKN